MKFFQFSFVILVTLLAVGCGGSDTASDEPAADTTEETAMAEEIVAEGIQTSTENQEESAFTKPEIEIESSKKPSEKKASASMTKEPWMNHPSGVEYYDITTGTGDLVEVADIIVAHYTLWLEDGTMLQTSVGSDPFQRPIGMGALIPGWDAAVPGMKVGGKRKLKVPGALAYGENPPPGSGIAPNATLTFEIEIVDAYKSKPMITNAKDWTTHASGVQIKDEVVGEGTLVEPGDQIQAHYTLWLEDGTMIQTSKDSQPFATYIGMGQLIPGWDLCVPGMREGGVRKMKVPAKLAYGANPDPRSGIPPNADLTFEIEVLRVAKSDR